MPSSLGHFTVAYLIYKSKNTLSLPALTIGAVISDLDIILNFLTRGYLGREVLHSFFGAGTLGTLLSSLLTAFFYPSIVSAFFGINKEEIRRVCELSKTVLVSSFVGGLSHVLIDSTCHNYNPLFYPFSKQSIDILLLPYDWRFSYFIVEMLLFAVLLTKLLIDLSRKGTKAFWKRMLVGGD